MVKDVLWSTRAEKQFKELYDYIKKDSVNNAAKVRADIIALTHKIALHPEIYPLDKYRKNNNGSFRASELHSYRIAYRITAKSIIIIRIRHTKRQPKMY